MYRIHARTLVHGGGGSTPSGILLLADGRITYAGPAAGAPPARPEETVVTVPVAMPGLWDCHTHFSGVRGPLSTERLMLTPAEIAVARSVRDARRALHAGFTSVRELGGYGIYLAQVIDEGSAEGPTVYSAGRVISPSGGHSDAHSLPYPWVVDPHRRDGMLQVADGEAECLRAVRLQLRMGAKVIKICASGGVISELDHPRHQQFSDAELKVMVAEAARAERVVAAHCHGIAGIRAAVRAGCRTIEHGTELDERTASEMKSADATLVPTRTAYEAILTHRDEVPPAALRKLTELEGRHREAMAIARAVGVRVAAGTDLGTSTPGSPFAWGGNGAEFVHLVAAGFSPEEAVAAGTALAPLTLGPQAPRSGQLTAGYDADVLGLTGNPLEDIAILARPAEITHVWKTGKLVKQPAAVSA
ncbi:amidohydrolase family protein [Parafrankia sp. FMc2]|uniref:amidohydrolase family protein n=1 Tax=Parafrankia sp. FMc2 TaxID=3233196 RepID=UPI0034D60317